MVLLSRLRLRTKLAALVGVSAFAMVAIAVTAATTMHQSMLADRIDKMRAAVNSAVSIAAALDARVEAREITRDQALDLLHGDIRAIRFDNGSGYLAVLDATTGKQVMHGANPALEGKAAPNDIATGRPISASSSIRWHQPMRA